MYKRQGEYCICVTQADGALSLSLECRGWEVLELDDGREEAVFYGEDPSYPVRVEVQMCIRDRGNIV